MGWKREGLAPELRAQVEAAELRMARLHETAAKLHAKLQVCTAVPPTSPALTKGTDKPEKDIQREIADWLRERGQTFLVTRTDKRTTGCAGWPDFSFCVARGPRRGRAVGLEVKRPGGKPEPHQEAMHERLRKDGWVIRVVTSLNEVKELIEELEEEFE